ncbi:MAG: glycosyltransferase [Floccifex sp.]
MKVLHISWSDSSGGAAIAAKRLHLAMISCGIDSKMLLLNPADGDEKKRKSIVRNYSDFVWKCYIKSALPDKQYRENGDRGLYSYFSIGNNIIAEPDIHDADIIYLHWVCGGFINFKELNRIIQLNKPVIWYMHDMFPITGGCHHSFDCEGYRDGCVDCPFFEKHKRMTAHHHFSKKKKIKEHKNMYWVSPSEWLYECAKASLAIDENRLFLVPNVIDDGFIGIDKKISRAVLNLPLDKKIILYGADHVVTNPYKGFDYFCGVMDKLKNDFRQEEILVLMFGCGENDVICERINYNIRFVGMVYDELVMKFLYSAADVFVSTSIAENYPLTVIESLSCDTPVVAFDVGGIKDMINYTRNGFLVNRFDVEQMARDIFEILHGKLDLVVKKDIKDICGERVIVKKHVDIWGNISR